MTSPDFIHSLMQQAITLSKLAAQQDEVPVAAFIFNLQTHEILSSAYNQMLIQNDPTAHAEILCIREVCQKLGTNYLTNCALLVTLEPCPMCAAAISFAKIKTLYYGAYDPKSGAVDHNSFYFNQKYCHHKPDVFGGILEPECGQVMKDFFKTKREV